MTETNKTSSEFECVNCGDKNVCDKENCFHHIQMTNKYIAMRDATIRKDEREKILDDLQEHNDCRIKGLEILFATPKEQRTETAQDIYLKEAYFELRLVKELIDSLRDNKQ